MARKDAILSMRELLLTRRDALRKALDGDLSLLRKLEATTGDVADYALDAAQDELTSQLAEVESRELSYIENALMRMRAGDVLVPSISRGRSVQTPPVLIVARW